MDNSKLIQLIRESINDYIREIDEAGNVAALEAKMGKTKEAIELREKKMNMDGLDEAYHDMLDKGKMKELSNEVKALKKSLAKYEKQLDKLKNKASKAEKTEDTEEKEIVDEVSIDETFPESGPQLEELDEARFKKGTDIGKKGKGFAKIAKSAAKEYGSEEAGKRVAGAILKKVLKKEEVNESFLHMQKLAGLITESEFKQLTENKTLFTPSKMSDGDQIYVIEYNGEKFEFSYQEYDDAYICLEPWDNNVAQLFKYLKSEGVKAIIDVAPEKTIIIKKDEFEKFI